MKKWKCTALGLLATIAMAPRLYAQIPDASAATSAATSAGTSAIPTKNIWSMFCLTPDQAAKCKDKLCNSPLGQMLTSAAKPVTLMTGGLLFANCGVPTADDLKKLEEGSAEGEAAKIKKSEAEAKARRAAIRYLGTVDCNWYPQAKGALINGLRVDPNECVRYEAALALLHGCCCNKEIMVALKISANGTKEDGNPPENSCRVRETAAEALAHCAEVYVEPGKPGDQKKQKEVVPPPMASVRGKGLMGILASAATPPSAANPQVKSLPPVSVAQKDQTAVAAPAPQWTVVQTPEKKGLLNRIDWGGRNSSSQPKEVMPLVKITPTVADTPVTPVTYGSVPAGYSPVPPIQNAGPFSTSSSSNNYNPTFVPTRPGEETATPTRGTVDFDSNR